ncbi:MAG: hypothetical protein KIT11_02830 [Fimbriimonadaceae bacterium]|nr:hypothetical protein [Fimbriimonadaceae bacterium]QYK54697.1 MAG: hypothetical protein KF733_06695 [Fimbriimonadaceae bacterium]
MDGVKDVKTDQPSLTATVVYDGKVTTAEKIAKALGDEQARYAATVKSKSVQPG